ncbi:MAG: DDE-type integrase/transposase/recombinase [Pseudonocardiales bacterium]|nr:DDE-type integrase/transposase/recombinase [Pseudonocardiales bacterium]MBV9031693.1 DDE-type integrase/transposase/recombinase [Pseudonocardiales bacterium]
MSGSPDLVATRRFFARALRHGTPPTEVTTDRAQAYPRVLDELVPPACHVMETYADDPIKTDHGRLKSRLRPVRGFRISWPPTAFGVAADSGGVVIVRDPRGSGVGRLCGGVCGGRVVVVAAR